MYEFNEGDAVSINRGAWTGATGTIEDVRVDHNGKTILDIYTVRGVATVPATMVNRMRAA